MLHLLDELGVSTAIERTLDDARPCWVLAQEILSVPIACGADRTGTKVATTVGTHALKHLLYACGAKRAFKRADPGFGRMGGKEFFAVFTTGAQFKHQVGSQQHAPRVKHSPAKGSLGDELPRRAVSDARDATHFRVHHAPVRTRRRRL
jgi:hypothetical protein